MAKTKSAALKPGDHVQWSSSGGTTIGVVTRKLTRTAKAGGHTAKPSKTDPQYEVKSEKSGKRAIHKREALKKLAY